MLHTQLACYIEHERYPAPALDVSLQTDTYSKANGVVKVVWYHIPQCGLRLHDNCFDEAACTQLDVTYHCIMHQTVASACSARKKNLEYCHTFLDTLHHAPFGANIVELLLTHNYLGLLPHF